MKFILKCKVCNEVIPEGSNLLKHILNHEAILYFDVVPLLAWVTEEKKPVKKEDAGEE